MTDPDHLDGLLRAYRLATTKQGDPFSPIEAMRQEQRAAETAREIADLLLASLPMLDLAAV